MICKVRKILRKKGNSIVKEQFQSHILIFFPTLSQNNIILGFYSKKAENVHYII